MSNKLYEGTTFVEGAQVPATKLNAFDDSISDGFDLIAHAIVCIVSDNSVIDDPDVDTELEVTATTPASMNVSVNVGVACISSTVCQNAAQATLRINTPTTSNRYTIVQISNYGVISTKNSTETATPAEPGADANNIKLAAIYLPQSTAIIEDTDDGNGYIIDRRAMSSITGGGGIGSGSKDFFYPGSLLTISGPAGDGFIVGSSSTGMRFNAAVQLLYCTVQLQEATLGADTILTVHNITQAMSDIVTILDGTFGSLNSAINIDFDVNDELAIQVTQQGTTQQAGWANIILGYVGANAPQVSEHNIATVDVTAENQWTGSIYIGGTFNFVITGTWSATVTFQVSFDEGISWIDVETFIANTYEVGETPYDPTAVYRAGVKTGQYVSGTVEIRISQ